MWANNRGFVDTAGSDPAVSLTTRCQWHCWICFRCLIDTMESLTQIFKSDSESELFQWLSRFSRRLRSHMRNGFSPCISAIGGIVWWKDRGSKISCHCPFKFCVFWYILSSYRENFCRPLCSVWPRMSWPLLSVDQKTVFFFNFPYFSWNTTYILPTFALVPTSTHPITQVSNWKI
jgi:hypothetical protein